MKAASLPQERGCFFYARKGEKRNGQRTRRSCRDFRHDPARRGASPRLFDDARRENPPGRTARPSRRRRHRSRIRRRVPRRLRERPPRFRNRFVRRRRVAFARRRKGHRRGVGRRQGRGASAHPYVSRDERPASRLQTQDVARGRPEADPRHGRVRAPEMRRRRIFGRRRVADRRRFSLPRGRRRPSGRGRRSEVGRPARSAASGARAARPARGIGALVQSAARQAVARARGCESAEERGSRRRRRSSHRARTDGRRLFRRARPISRRAGRR